jgi:hypothetical protein
VDVHHAFNKYEWDTFQQLKPWSGWVGFHHSSYQYGNFLKGRPAMFFLHIRQLPRDAK